MGFGLRAKGRLLAVPGCGWGYVAPPDPACGWETPTVRCGWCIVVEGRKLGVVGTNDRHLPVKES